MCGSPSLCRRLAGWPQSMTPRKMTTPLSPNHVRVPLPVQAASRVAAEHDDSEKMTALLSPNHVRVPLPVQAASREAAEHASELAALLASSAERLQSERQRLGSRLDGLAAEV